MNFKFVLLVLISIKAQFGVTKWNYLSKCSFEGSDTHVNYECEDSDKYVENSDLSCCTIGCQYSNPFRKPTATIKSLKFVNCKVSRLGIGLFQEYQLVKVGLSNMDLEILQSKDFHLATKLQKLNASHNHLSEISTGLFNNAPKLNQVDFSFNKIENVDVDPFENDFSEIEVINLSHNRIRAIDNRTFAKFSALTELNLEHNLIETIDTNAFSKNTNIKRILLDGNKLKEFICSEHFVIYELNLSYNRFKKFDGKCVIHDSLQINVLKYENENFPFVSKRNNRSAEGTWVYDEDDLSEMKLLNISNNRIDNIHGIIDRLREPLKSLDVTCNILGSLGADTFDKLINLEELVLRNTSLTTIKFGLFHHQKNLRLLDISNNNLKKIQFKAFGRNLINLQSFYLDGNNLTEVDGLKKESFPNVRFLGILDNNFTCEYLVDYLVQWNGVELIEDKLSNQAHVEKIACDKQLLDHSVQGESPTTSRSTTPAILASITLTTPESITPESITLEPTNSESTTPVSATPASTTPESTNPESTTSASPTTPRRIETTTSAHVQVQEKKDLHEKYLIDIFILLVFLSVILSLICIMVVVKYSISTWSSRKIMQMKSFELVSLQEESKYRQYK